MEKVRRSCWFSTEVGFWEWTYFEGNSRGQSKVIIINYFAIVFRGGNRYTTFLFTQER